MQWSRKLSLRHKITYVIMINTFAALCVASIAFAEYGVYRFKQMQMQDLNTLANVMATNSTAALAFKDQKSAADILQALSAKPHILAAAIYDPDGKPFAVYRRPTSKGIYAPPRVETESSRFTSDRVLIFRKITLGGEHVGNIFLEGDTVEYHQLLESYLLFFGLIVVAISLGAYAMAERLQRPIADPILRLAWTAKMVTGSRDYSIRAGKESEDEVGILIDGFNEMLAQIQIRDAELSGAREDLERRVDERTLELEQEVGDRQRAQEALHESEGRIRLLLDSTAEAIYGIDRDGQCTFCNPATLRLLGHQKPEDLVGKTLHNIIHHTHADGTPYPEVNCTISASLRKGNGIHSDEEVFWRTDGSSFPVEYWAHPIRNEGEIVGAVVTFLDITERKRAEEALRKSKEAAEAGSRAKSEFLANMSHEIRTPMNGIIGMTDLALDTDLTTEQREYLSLVKSSAESLLHLINDILDFSKIEAGKFELEETEFEIRDLFSNTLKTLAVRADKKHLELSVRVSAEVPRVVAGDATRLRQLIVNLVGNAIKFTERGNVVVNAELESQSSDGVHLHILVSDTGIGIPPEKQQLIFESFAQADGSTTRRFGGTGLGLTISRRIVEMMAGRIWVESKIGQGSVFHFTATFRHSKTLALSSERPERLGLEGQSVLVVDDNDTNCKILAEMLTNWRMNPVLAESGANALSSMEAARRAGHPFSIVLLDAQMPGMDGFSLAEKVHGKPGLAGPIVLMLSADRLQADTARCLDVGVNAFLSKPIGQSELLDAILLALGMRAVQNQSIQPSPPIKEPPKGRGLNILLAEDNFVNQKLAIRMLEKAGYNVTLAANGREVLKALEQAHPPGFDVVLMDIQMPELDGLEATAAIRDREKSSREHLPIIAMTANAMRGDRERYLDGGMDGYISKPINSLGLFAEIERCLAEVKRSTAMAKIHSQHGEQLDRASLLERVEGDQELLAEMIQLFLADAPQLLEAMRKALLQGDMILLERSAHSMKGAAGNMSAEVTVGAALRLEQSAKKGDAESSKANLATLEGAIERLLPVLADLCQEVSK
jgi:two-component system sensor histidine kinase/response regulator